MCIFDEFFKHASGAYPVLNVYSSIHLKSWMDGRRMIGWSHDIVIAMRGFKARVLEKIQFTI